MPGLITEREKMLEAMLFASPESVPLEKLAEALECDIPLTRNLLNRMAETYARDASGIQLQEVDGAYRLCTNPAYYPAVQRLLQRKGRAAFSQAVLETLAIIAFKQPVTKGVIEGIRGVNSDYSVNKLVECGLVTEIGRLDAPGRPILFGTSEDFLLYYGIKSVDELLESMSHINLEDDEVNDNGRL
ncbi:MAG: SMC-Scp complex subunit ScpB [Firmicutes bacterium]|nr:SMC-Scp complex subunit ScpB [Bacillota bacterium]